MEAYRKLIKIDDDALAELYIQLATQAVLDYTNRLYLLDTMKPLVAELASHYVENIDRQGITSRSEGAISETYADTTSTNGIPGFIKTRLDRYRLLHIAKRTGANNASPIF